MKTRLPELQAEAEELNQTQNAATCMLIGFSFRFCFRLWQSGFHWIVNDGVVSEVGRKWKRSDSSDFDSVALMILLTTPILDFQKVISALTTPLTIPTPTLICRWWKPAFKDLEKAVTKFTHYTCKISKITLKQLSKKHISRNIVSLLITTVNSVKALLNRLKSITYEWYRKLPPFSQGHGSLRAE